jgi:hypothetical protein
MGMLVGLGAGLIAFVCAVVLGTVVVLLALEWIAAYGLLMVALIAVAGVLGFGFVAGMAIGLSLS